MKTDGVRLDHVAICEQAIGTLQRRGVCQWIERDELIAEGCLALIAAGVGDEALGVVIARRAMVDAIRRNEVRQRGREYIAAREDESVSDPWDAMLYAKSKLPPVGRELDVWEAIKALPAREYRVVMSLFWGNRTQAQIAEDLGIDQSGVSRIWNAARKSLRECINRDSRAMTNTEGRKRPNRQA